MSNICLIRTCYIQCDILRHADLTFIPIHCYFHFMKKQPLSSLSNTNFSFQLVCFTYIYEYSLLKFTVNDDETT